MKDLDETDRDLAELEEIDKRESAKRFTPNGKSEEFIAMVGANKTFVNLFIGANSTSKTATGVNIVTNIIYGPQNGYFEYPLFRKWPYIKRGRIISDPTTIKEKIIPELKKWLPYNDAKQIPSAPYETAKEGVSYERKFRTNTGWEIDIMSNEQDVKEFESVDLGFVWFDEPAPKDRFMATIARGRLGMTVIWTLTPLTYSAWIKDWLDEHADGEYAGYVEAEMEDNCIDHGVRGILEHSNIKRIAAAFPEDEQEARVFGKFGHLIGRVHKRFKRSIHVIKPFSINERDFTTYIALDPHPRAADHVLYMSVDYKGTKFITGEIIGEGHIRELCERMKAFEASTKYRIETRIIDPSAYVDDQHRAEGSVSKQFLDLGMHFIAGSKDLMGGIKRTDDALNYQMQNGQMIQPPELYIFDTCPVAIKQLDEYVWGEWRGRSADEKQPKAKPRDRDDHQVENLHRLLLHEPHHIPIEFRQELPMNRPANISGFAGAPEGAFDYHDSDLDPYD